MSLIRLSQVVFKSPFISSVCKPVKAYYPAKNFEVVFRGTRQIEGSDTSIPRWGMLIVLLNRFYDVTLL